MFKIIFQEATSKDFENWSKHIKHFFQNLGGRAFITSAFSLISRAPHIYMDLSKHGFS